MEVLPAVLMKMNFFWDVTFCRLINGYEQWMKTLLSLETLVIMYQSAWHNITEDSNCHMYRTLYYHQSLFLPTDGLISVLENFKIYIKIYIETCSSSFNINFNVNFNVF